MKRIYTRTGDRGTTSLHGGVRVAKTDVRIEANGSLDELNVEIGMVRSMLPLDSEMQPWLRTIQLNLMALMSRVATPSARLGDNPNTLPQGMVEEVESWIDALTERIGETDSFLLPGGTPVSAMMHRARVAARRAERRLWALDEVDRVEPVILAYVNRLSDLFFVMARAEMTHAEMPEEVWKEFVYKRRKRLD
ncbi:MAG: cob(I)yrinic acid a,c-diamide adenosyltransferase [Muribaculaceae bacterium]|nr:cob(I)yrinic acid a,c-diamide adenosyltransferase [Muribaculaceae bacterium]